MKLSKQLRLEKTNVGIKANTTFNAPGNYVPPYGKTKVRIGGRGQSGNYSSGGNYAGEYYAGEAYAGTNPSTNAYAGTNPSTPGNVVGTLYQWFDNDSYTSYSEYQGFDASNIPPSTSGAYHAEYGAYYNAGTPGNAYYSQVPGNAYYTPYYAAYYNTYYPGYAATPVNIGGVVFPGGSADSIAPVVPASTTTLAYSPTGFSVVVPAGGYVTIDNI